MSIIEIPTTTVDADAFRLVALDLYRDIHKGLRAELFAVTGEAGRVDPADRSARLAIAGHVTSVAEVLEAHAEHEDAVIEPALQIHLPDLAEQIAADHRSLERRVESFVDLAQSFSVASATEQRRLGHLLYLDLASFTGDYLLHQHREETVVMPALDAAVGFEAVLAMHQAIVGSIPPDQMAQSLAFMLPAMNVDDRVELLGGMREGAPPEVFTGVLALAESVLAPTDASALLARLGTS